MTPKEKLKKIKLGIHVVGKKGCGKVTAFGPGVVIYEYTYNRERHMVKEPIEDIWLDSAEEKLPAGWSGESLKEKK